MDVSNAEELRRQLLALHRAAELGDPLMVELTVNNGDSLGIGLGRPMSVLVFTSGTKRPPYYTSQGRAAGGSRSVLTFEYGGQPTGYPIDQAVPLPDALNAMIEFFETGVRSDSINWQEV